MIRSILTIFDVTVRDKICRDYKRYNAKKMKADLKTVDWSPFYEHTNVNRAWAFMKNVLTHIFQRHAPVIVRKVRGKPAPWLSTDVKNLMNERDKLLRKSR